MALPEYLRLLTTWPEMWERVREGESGMGGRRKRVHPDKLLAVLIPLPQLREQARLIDLVNACDSAAEQTAVLVRAAQNGWRALADELIGSLERRHPLGSAADVTMGRQRSPKDASGAHMVPYLRAANVKDGRLELDDVLEMNFTPAEQKTFTLRIGDVLVTEGCGSLGQLGASAIWGEARDEVVCFQNTLLRLRAIEGTTTPAFLHHLARYSHRAGWWATIASGTNIFHIGSERAKAMPIPLPTLAEQDRITSVLDAADEVGRRATAQLAASRDARSRLLNDLLSGAHEIPASYDELLERVS